MHYQDNIRAGIPLMVYITSNMLNDCIAMLALWRESIAGLTFFIGCSFALLITSTLVSFSPIIFFHLAIIFITFQVRSHLVQRVCLRATSTTTDRQRCNNAASSWCNSSLIVSDCLYALELWPNHPWTHSVMHFGEAPMPGCLCCPMSHRSNRIERALCTCV
jgi:hypothetical protein